MSWLSYHLFYHGDRDRLLLELVRPLAGSLLAAGCVDRFFFLRYPLGGPHVRLRLRALAGRDAEIESRASAAASAFFERCPSVTPKPEEEVRASNRTLLATDPNEHDDAVYPDNSLRIFPFRPETDRYGGPALLDCSLDFFAGSSVSCLELLAAHQGAPWSRRSPGVFRILARLALGFSRTVGELRALLDYPTFTWGESLSAIAREGDGAFERNRKAYCRLFQSALDDLFAPAPPLEIELARALGREVRETALPVRRTVLSSHLHMTANRLGLSNLEEVYLGRILWRAADESRAACPALGERLGEGADASSRPPLAELASTLLAGLARRRGGEESA
jgi:hypothetical protein